MSWNPRHIIQRILYHFATCDRHCKARYAVRIGYFAAGFLVYRATYELGQDNMWAFAGNVFWLVFVLAFAEMLKKKILQRSDN